MSRNWADFEMFEQMGWTSPHTISECVRIPVAEHLPAADPVVDKDAAFAEVVEERVILNQGYADRQEAWRKAKQPC